MQLRSASILAVTLAISASAFASHAPRHKAATHSRAHVVKASAPRIMDSARATQIQTALIAQGYLTGTPSGTWDEQSQAAMVKLQADNHWQTKIVPDSRAIIKLGLGPNPGSTLASPETAESTFADTPAIPAETKQ